jgi:hypothetical protein
MKTILSREHRKTLEITVAQAAATPRPSHHYLSGRRQPVVMQLFTEQSMVAFLLENALGGWWQSRHPNTKLPVAMPYLRFAPSRERVGERGRSPSRQRRLFRSSR